jgi:8-oxo-dGTP pyrophosphatase MutT (NUDIX family)
MAPTEGRTLPKRPGDHKRGCSMTGDNPCPAVAPPDKNRAMSAAYAALRDQITDYARRWPAEREVAEQFLTLLDDPANPFVREQLDGHMTAGAWLVSGDGQRILMTHHRKLDRWLQLGGHADGDTDMARVALKEAEEESGLSGLVVEDGIFDLDRHWIPERKDVPGHWHYDVRYVIRATGSEDYVVSEESLDLAWRDIAPMVADDDASISRMARKWVAWKR